MVGTCFYSSWIYLPQIHLEPGSIIMTRRILHVCLMVIIHAGLWVKGYIRGGPGEYTTTAVQYGYEYEINSMGKKKKG